MGQPTKTIHVHRHQQHLKWSRDIPPVLTIESGETVTFDALDGSNGMITKESTADAIMEFDVEKADPGFGPIYINGAEPGDVLKVDILDLQLGDWAWTAIVPGFGLLADDFPEAKLKIWHIDPTLPYVKFKEGVHIRKAPFLGIMGVAPGVKGEFSTIPPLETGGNMDCRYLTAGSSLYLPIRTRGALFSCGDGHTAQGDGEVCGTAIETTLTASLRLTVCKNQPWVTAPQFQTPPLKQALSASDINSDKGEYATMGIDSDLLEATRKATRSMIEWLTCTKNLTREEAYMLTSVAGCLKMVEVVDMPNYGIVMTMPLSIFVTPGQPNGVAH
ncbi:acetamidase/formamidase family protein [Arthroderma uncinatum]|uniref:acetamidase/formamidase family protein n=1 Tax=Arthroderma uncinatum TaxID=74035 RepID=UPI00144ADE7E|nr:acetamidase/formamidase family protein [Arthroderma uncinatum]KAF3490501.1 acetamidase/formamidase family protein [Arthroderma uncinatum]